MTARQILTVAALQILEQTRGLKALTGPVVARLSEGALEVRLTLRAAHTKQLTACPMAILNLMKDCPLRWTTSTILEEMEERGHHFADSTIKAWLAELCRRGLLISHRQGVRGYSLPPTSHT